MKKMNFKSQTKQAGFTLIELIVVIVILGIMAATALPKFMDLGADARVAKMTAAGASIKTVMATSRAAMLAQGNKLDAVVTIDGVPGALQGGAPKVGDLKTWAGLEDYYVIGALDTEDDGDADTVQIASDAEHKGCAITYTQATVTQDGSGKDVVLAADAAKVSALPGVAVCS